MKRVVMVGGLGAAYGWLVHTRGVASPYRFPTDVRDTAIIEADPHEVFTALIDEGDGSTTWWAPHHTMQVIEGDSCADVGAVVANTVMVRGRFPVEFTTRTTKVVPDEEMRIEYIDGAFRGTAQWNFEAANGGTRVSLRWRTTPAGRLGALAALLPIERSHSDSVEAGFRNLSAYLAGQAAEVETVE